MRLVGHRKHVVNKSSSPLDQDRKEKKKKRPSPYHPFKGTAPMTWGTLRFLSPRNGTKPSGGQTASNGKQNASLCRSLFSSALPGRPQPSWPLSNATLQMPQSFLWTAGWCPLQHHLISFPISERLQPTLTLPNSGFLQWYNGSHIYRNHTLNSGLSLGSPPAQQYNYDAERWPWAAAPVGIPHKEGGLVPCAKRWSPAG